jgi:hypothetical protein
LSFFEKIKTFNTNWVIALVIISVTWVNFNQVRWNKKDVIDHDIRHYYSYLPALFYEHDLSLSFIKDTVNWSRDGQYYWPNKTPAGNPVIKMTMGMAFGYLPFFALAHVYAGSFNYEVDGFSEPYQFAVLFSSLVYFLIGLVFLSRTLKFWFDEKIISITLFCICLGTNVFYYLTFGGGLSHTFNFGLISAFLYYTILWHKRPRFWLALVCGSLLGLIVLVRPINILLFILFILYDITSIKEISKKIKFLLTCKLHLFVLLVCSFLFVLPQLLYWKYVTGNYFFNSYVGERFYFNHPHVLDGLLSFRKGWLIYTPIMLFPLIGLFYLKYDLKKFLLPILVFLVIYLYATFSWWCWWYGGSFGQRVMIDIYPVLAIPLAAFFLKVKELRPNYKKSVYLLVCLLVLLNIFQTAQAKFNIIHYDSMTAESYFKNFFSLSKKPGNRKYLQKPDYQKALKGENEY